MGVCSSTHTKCALLDASTPNLPRDYIYYELHGLMLWEVRNLHIQLQDGISIANGPISVTTQWKFDKPFLSKLWILQIENKKFFIDPDVTRWQKFVDFAVRVKQSPAVLEMWTFLPRVICTIILDYIKYAQTVEIFLPDQAVNLSAELDGVSIGERIHLFCHHHIEPQITVNEFDDNEGVYKILTCTQREYRVTRLRLCFKCSVLFTLRYKGKKTYSICIWAGQIYNPCPNLLTIRCEDKLLSQVRYLSFGVDGAILSWSPT